MVSRSGAESVSVEDRKRDRHEPGVDSGRDGRRQHRDQGREHDKDEQQKAARTRGLDRDQHLDDERPARPLEGLAEDEPAPPGLERDAVRILAQEALRQRQHQRHRGGDEDEPQERVLKRDPDRRDGADRGREPEQRHRGARPVLGEKPDELVVERPLEADRRGQALADVADVLREAAPARAVIRRRSADPADHLRRRLTHHATRNPPGRRQPTPRQSHHGGDWLTILFRRSGSPRRALPNFHVRQRTSGQGPSAVQRRCFLLTLETPGAAKAAPFLSGSGSNLRPPERSASRRKLGRLTRPRSPWFGFARRGPLDEALRRRPGAEPAPGAGISRRERRHGPGRLDRPCPARAQGAGLCRRQPAAANPGSRARRRHRHQRVDRDLPLFRGTASRAAAVRHRRARAGACRDVAAAPRVRPARHGRGGFPPPPPGDGRDGGAAGRRPGARPTSRGSSSSCAFSTASSPTAGSSPATASRSPTSPGSSGSIS